MSTVIRMPATDATTRAAAETFAAVLSAYAAQLRAGEVNQ